MVKMHDDYGGAAAKAAPVDDEPAAAGAGSGAAAGAGGAPLHVPGACAVPSPRGCSRVAWWSPCRRRAARAGTLRCGCSLGTNRSSTLRVRAATSDSVQKLLADMPRSGSTSTALVVATQKKAQAAAAEAGVSSLALTRRTASEVPKPKWHAPWKLMRVISGHNGWVRSIAVEPGNEWFVTGAADRTIKVRGGRFDACASVHLCCAVLCCAVLCCAVLCCAVLCCAVLCCAVLCCAVLCCAVL